MEYIAALEERLSIQDRKIKELENHSRTVSIPPTDTSAASTISGISSQSSGSRVDEMKAAMQKMSETVSSQETLVAYFTKHIANNGGGGGGSNGGDGGKPTVKKDNHKCKKCKKMVWHKEEDFLEYERNTHKRWVAWESALK